MYRNSSRAKGIATPRVPWTRYFRSPNTVHPFFFTIEVRRLAVRCSHVQPLVCIPPGCPSRDRHARSYDTCCASAPSNFQFARKSSVRSPRHAAYPLGSHPILTSDQSFVLTVRRVIENTLDREGHDNNNLTSSKSSTIFDRCQRVPILDRNIRRYNSSAEGFLPIAVLLARAAVQGRYKCSPTLFRTCCGLAAQATPT